MADENDDLFAEALRAATPAPLPPAGFTDRVMTALARRRTSSRRSMRVVVSGSLLVAAAACAVFAWTRREIRGEADARDARAPVTVMLGRRGRAVLEPGTAVSYRVGGVFGGVDRVDVSRGAVFFRIDTGGAFEVHTPAGTVSVTGTCFRVAVDDERGGSEMAAVQRARWFGAGAMSVALAVSVYEGGVRVANAHGRESVHLAPGERATVSQDGRLAREAIDPANGSTNTADARVNPIVANGAALADASEVTRLRSMLRAHGISPETGALVAAANTASAQQPAAAADHPGIAQSGNTDLTSAEWRQLAERGELRWRLPGFGGNNRGSIDDARADALRIPQADVDQLNDAMRRSRDHLVDEVRGFYREAVGSDPGNMSWDSLMSEIGDKTAESVVAQVNRQLSQERGGLSPVTPIRADMTPYERMMRALVNYESQLEQDFAAIVGPQLAHDLIWGEHSVSAHSYGIRSSAQP